MSYEQHTAVSVIQYPLPLLLLMKERQTITLASVFVGEKKELNKRRAGGMEMKTRIFVAFGTHVQVFTPLS